MNMRTAYLSMGAAETCLLSSGEMALAKYYGMPTTRMGGYSDSQWPDVQAGIEKAMALLILAQSEADFVTMGGPLDNAAHHSYEQVVIDHDIWEMAQRLTTEIVVDDDTLAYDVIEKVGPGGSFLGETHTRRAVQAGEHYYGGSFNHTGRAPARSTRCSRGRTLASRRSWPSRSPTARRPTPCSGSRSTCATTPSRRRSNHRSGRVTSRRRVA